MVYNLSQTNLVSCDDAKLLASLMTHSTNRNKRNWKSQILDFFFSAGYGFCFLSDCYNRPMSMACCHIRLCSFPTSKAHPRGMAVSVDKVRGWEGLVCVCVCVSQCIFTNFTNANKSTLLAHMVDSQKTNYCITTIFTTHIIIHNKRFQQPVAKLSSEAGRVSFNSN